MLAFCWQIFRWESKKQREDPLSISEPCGEARRRAARGSVGTPPAAAPRPPLDLLLSNATACPAWLYKTCQERYFCSRLDGIWLFWKPDPEHLALLCFALPILDLYGVRQRVSLFQEAVPETIAVASAGVFSF